MRRFLLFVCAVVAVGSFANAQELDLAAGGSTLWSTKNLNASQAFLPPAEKGGTYASVTAQYFFGEHLGVGAEAVGRYKQDLYNGYQKYRPFLYDINGVYTRSASRKVRVDAMLGVGAETLLFYNQFYTCTISSGGCANYVDSSHFLAHVGLGVRYYFWRSVFVRPEAHLYYINNNLEFHSNSVYRLGASVGYRFGKH